MTDGGGHRAEELDTAWRDTVVALWRSAGLTRPWNDPVTDFDRAVRGPTSAVLGILEGERLLATAMVGHDGHRGWLYYVAVADDVRGTGLGRQIMAGAEDWLRRAGAPKAQLMVRTDNAGAADFYRHLGYEAADTTVLGRRLDG